MFARAVDLTVVHRGFSNVHMQGRGVISEVDQCTSRRMWRRRFEDIYHGNRCQHPSGTILTRRDGRLAESVDHCPQHNCFVTVDRDISLLSVGEPQLCWHGSYGIDPKVRCTIGASCRVREPTRPWLRHIVIGLASSKGSGDG